MADAPVEQPLTSPAFWDDFWTKGPEQQFPIQPESRFTYDKSLMDVLSKNIQLSPTDRVLEIGCAPGKWLVYFHKQFGCQIAGCDWSEKGLAVLRQNLQSAKMTAQIYSGDFLKLDFDGQQFDTVMSYGFIEHFDDPQPIIKRHVELVKPGGTLILEVPNHRGVNRPMQDRELLRAHNLNTMTRSFFEDIATRYNLEVQFLEYVGGFEPANLNSRHRPMPYRVLHKGLSILRQIPGMDKVNSELWSGYLVGIFKRRVNSPLV